MRISIGLSSRMSPTMCVHYARLALLCGLDGVWVGEYLYSPITDDWFAPLSFSLPQVHIGTAIVSIYMRSAEELYALAEQFSTHPAGFSLGMGVGDLSLLSEMGIVPAEPVERMEHCLKEVAPLRGKGMEVLVGSGSRAMLERTSSHADGVILTGSVEQLRERAQLVEGRRVFWSPLWLDSDEPNDRAKMGSTEGEQVEPEELAVLLSRADIDEVIVGPPRGSRPAEVMSMLARTLRDAP
ncbi:MAG: LLM class oxidoreductase [Methermicoccaceae archaeon]